MRQAGGNGRELLEETPATPQSRLKWLLVALIAMQGGALALKAWDDHKTRDAAAMTTLQREAMALTERVDGKIAGTITAMEYARRAATRRSIVADMTPGIDAVVTLRDAAGSPSGSRMRTAADLAADMITRGERSGVTSQGDIVILNETNGYAPTIALGKASEWIPKPTGERRIAMTGSAALGTGSNALAVPDLSSPLLRPTISTAEGRKRSATACAPLNSSALAVCSTVARPWMSQSDLISLLIYSLLLAAPSFAIYGLMSLMTRRREYNERDDSEAAKLAGTLDTILKGAKAGYFEWSPADNAVTVDAYAASQMDAGVGGEMTVTQFTDLIAPSERDRFTAGLARAQDMDWLQISVPTAGSEGKVWVELRGSLTAEHEGDAPTFCGIITDVTERVKSEARLKAAERRLRNAIEGYSGPFALWDSRKRLLYWNRAFAIDFGLEDTLRPGVGHDTVSMARAGGIKHERASDSDPRTMIFGLHSGRWIKLVERPTSEGGLISVGVDMSDTMRNEQKLRVSEKKMRSFAQNLEISQGHNAELARKYNEEKMKAEHAASTKSAFLANMSHELRTPLNAINGFSEIIAHELYGPIGDARYKGYANDILSSGQHLLDMINDILDMAKIESGKMSVHLETIDPIDPVDAAVRMIRRKAEDKGITVATGFDNDLPEIEADHRAIRQMVLNLISNAIKFTDEGGKITIGVQGRRNEVRIFVTDTGVGIPQADLPRLARPFEQVSETRDRNYEGTGLGLALTKSFAEMHGGRLTIASEEGKGTTVSIYLPMEAADASAGEDLFEGEQAAV